MRFLPTDRSVVDALSWRLAAELARRHPDALVLNRGHPGGGQYDCLMLVEMPLGPGRIMLNREGTIQVHGRFDGLPADEWPATSWEAYMRADPWTFLHALEGASGLPSPVRAPASTPATLLYRVLAALTAAASKTPDPYDIQQGFIDSSGYSAGPNPALDAFPGAASHLRRVRAGAPSGEFGEPGLGYWMVWRRKQPLWAVERNTAEVWTANPKVEASLTDLYASCGRQLEPTVAHLASLLR